jgi:amidohydrolase
MEIQSRIKELAEELFKEIRDIRRHLHANPELSWQEFGTSDFIAAKLEEERIRFNRNVAKTGIVAFIEGNNPDSKTIALRADMDALPIQEANTCDYKSLNQGIMHACGHDVHMACLLGAAKILNRLKNNFDGTVRLIFQPSEESYPSGANEMIKEGVLENPVPKAIVGQHVFPQLPVGSIGVRPGKYMASTDEVYITVKGKGGHAAMPHLVIDPVAIAAHVLVALQQIPKLNQNPDIPTVLAFGRIIGDGRMNVIPHEVKIDGTFRTFDEEWRDLAHQTIKRLAQETAKKMGGTCEVRIERGFPFLVNDADLTANFRQWAQDYLGKENVHELDISMTAEDFAFYSHLIPACFYRLGVANAEKGITSGVHTPTFDIDEKALEIGSGLMAYAAIKRLND